MWYFVKSNYFLDTETCAWVQETSLPPKLQQGCWPYVHRFFFFLTQVFTLLYASNNFFWVQHDSRVHTMSCWRIFSQLLKHVFGIWRHWRGMWKLFTSTLHSSGQVIPTIQCWTWWWLSTSFGRSIEMVSMSWMRGMMIGLILKHCNNASSHVTAWCVRFGTRYVGRTWGSRDCL